MTDQHSDQPNRRDFLKTAVKVLGAGLVPALPLSGCSKSVLPKEEVQQIEEEPVIPAIEVVSQQVWYVNDANNRGYESMPQDSYFRSYPVLPSIPAVNKVPFQWDTENFSSAGGGCITDNVYSEPGQLRMLQLAISTPGQSDTQTGSPQYKVWYRISINGGVTFSALKQLIVEGGTSLHPIEGVQIGRNGFNVDFTRPIVRATNGEIMVPVGLHPWDEQNNQIYLPVPGAYLFQDAGVLIGKWTPDGNDITWNFGNWLRVDHNLSTRGLSEPTIIETATPGRFAMISRCSNLANLSLPCYARVSFSNDYCRTWSPPEPFTYSNGKPFFVTTAQSALFKSRTTGKTYWIGNLNTVNPQASHPRYPLVIGEVDLEQFGLIESSVIEVDTCRSGKDAPTVQLSNFKILEHRVKSEIIVYFTRREGTAAASRVSWFQLKLV